MITHIPSMPISGSRYCISRTFVTTTDNITRPDLYIPESIGMTKTEKKFFVGAKLGDYAVLYTYYYKEMNSGDYAYALSPTNIIETNSTVTADDLIS